MHLLGDLDRTVARWWPSFIDVPPSPLRNMYAGLVLLTVGLLALLFDREWGLAAGFAALGILIGTAVQLRGITHHE